MQRSTQSTVKFIQALSWIRRFRKFPEPIPKAGRSSIFAFSELKLAHLARLLPNTREQLLGRLGRVWKILAELKFT